jgi:hypothetical protein
LGQIDEPIFPGTLTQYLTSGLGAGGTHTALLAEQYESTALPQARAKVVQAGGGLAMGVSMGRHPPCFIVSGAIVTDCTQGTPPQSFPAGIAFSAVQVPVQSAGGSNDICGTLGPSPAQLAAAVVSVAGSSHEPIDGAHVQAPQMNVPSA